MNVTVVLSDWFAYALLVYTGIKLLEIAIQARTIYKAGRELKKKTNEQKQVYKKAQKICYGRMG